MLAANTWLVAPHERTPRTTSRSRGSAVFAQFTELRVVPNTQTNGQTDRQTDRQTDKQIDYATLHATCIAVGRIYAGQTHSERKTLVGLERSSIVA